MAKDKRFDKFKEWFANTESIRWIILFVVVATFVMLFYPAPENFLKNYAVGDVAERDIKAPRNFLIEDRDVTSKNKSKAVEGVLTVYDYNAALLPRLTKNIREAFASLRALMEQGAADAVEAPNGPERQGPDETVDIHEAVWGQKEQFEKKLGIALSSGAFSILEKERFASEIAERITAILAEIYQNGVVADKEGMLRESEQGIVLRNLSYKNEKVETNLKRFYGLDQAKTMVRVHGDPLLKGLNYNLKNLIVDFCQRLIQPNITLNRSETEERKGLAAEGIKTVFFEVKAGEMILREGERVTDLQLQKLQKLQKDMENEKSYIVSVGSTAIFLVFLLVLYLLVEDNRNIATGNRNKNILFLASVLVLFIVLGKVTESIIETMPRELPHFLESSSIVFGIPIASAAMAVCLFMGVEVAVAFGMLVSFCAAVAYGGRFDLFVYFFLGSAMGAYWIRDCRERKVFAKAGLRLGLLNMLLAGAIGLYMGGISGLSFLWDLAFGFLGGLGAGVFTAGLAPLFETLFGYATDVTLLELANLEQPILRKLMIEAPGTYHHSVVIGSLVEAAAAEIGANPLLAKVCGYFHDIGKVKKPLYFIENQRRSKNLHDKLAPSMSRRILIAHVKDGVEVAAENKLPKVVLDAIQQHHGTSLIRFFYDKAVKLQGDKSVKEEDYRYPGPKPSTKEAGLVMLADVCEAASRTLDNPTPARIQGLVQNLINKIFSDGQLDDCEITLRDLHKIAKNFNKILNGIHHHRIEYSDTPAPGGAKSKNGGPKNEKGKNDGPDNQQSNENKDIAGEGSDDGSSPLKRLGIS